jgi:serine/threonine-protein kinase
MGNANNEDRAGAGREPDAALARIGTVVDKYTIVRLLGRGGMGAVYEARHAMLARRFAIKFLLPEFAKNREILRRFENEARAAGGLEHPNVAAVTDFGRASDGSPYLVMEFLEGQDVAKLLRLRGSLAVPHAANLVMQACRGLAVAHKATIVHRDLKPENLFVTDAGDGSDLVKVLDFGIAKLRVADASVITGTGATFGTAFYMSPEQARGAGDVDPRTDVWSLGVVLYELLSGRKPFLGEQFLHVIHQILSSEPPPLATLRPELPPALISVVESAMKKELAQRLPSVVALSEALAPFAGARAAGEPRHSPQAVAPTLATPATNVGVREGENATGARRSVAPAVGEGSAPGASHPLKRALPWIIAVAGAGAVALFLARPPSERVPTASGATVSDTAHRPAPAPVPVPVPAAAPTPPPPPPVAPPARSVFEHGQSSSNTRLSHGAPKPKPAATPAPPSAAPETRAPGHRIEIDKDDPYGGP